MKNLKRMAMALCLAAMCLTASWAQEKNLEKIDLTAIGVDSVMQSHLSDSTVLKLAQMAIDHQEQMKQMEIQKEKISSRMLDNQEIGFLLFLSLIPVTYIICILIYKVIESRGRRAREEEKIGMLLNMVRSGQTLTPELVESITKEKKLEKEREVISMNDSLRKLFLGVGLLVFAIVLHCIISSKDLISPFLTLIGIFYSAQGLAGYLTLRQARQSNETNEPSKTE